MVLALPPRLAQVQQVHACHLADPIVTGPGSLSTPHQKLQFPRHSLSCLVFVVPRIFALKQWLMLVLFEDVAIQ